MLSAGRGLQLGQTHGGTSTAPWTGTVISWKEGWFLFIFLSISLPQGTAWPYGKRPALPSLLFSLAFIFGTASQFVFFVLKKPASATLSIPSSLLSFKSTSALSQDCKRRPTERQWCESQLFKGRQRKTALTSLCNRWLFFLSCCRFVYCPITRKKRVSVISILIAVNCCLKWKQDCFFVLKYKKPQLDVATHSLR